MWFLTVSDLIFYFFLNKGIFVEFLEYFHATTVKHTISFDLYLDF